MRGTRALFEQTFGTQLEEIRLDPKLDYAFQSFYYPPQLDFGQFRQPPGERYLAGKWIRREFCHCLGLAGTVKKLTRPIFDASNDL
jgi:hypothetical protein